MNPHFKTAVKSMKWWMYLPGACFKMGRWMFEPDEYHDRAWRYLIMMLNLNWTCLVICFVLGEIGFFK
jgi:hypothetical protein